MSRSWRAGRARRLSGKSGKTDGLPHPGWLWLVVRRRQTPPLCPWQPEAACRRAPPDFSNTPQVADYQRRLLAADHLVFAFPVWWEAMPAATKGFLDRVLIKGVLFEELPEARGNPFRTLMPRLAGVTVLSVMTTPDKAYRWWYRDPLTKILFKGTFGKIGVQNLTWVNYDKVADRTPEQRERLLRDTEARFAGLSPTSPSLSPTLPPTQPSSPAAVPSPSPERAAPRSR
ncbi:NAD(P)H-dependent oxidoreductase [Catenulispora sp. GAS73]|uniref:NAD(P)H-dependent oxidoreductase n=1 Tax=Catenulispora sp. GAS73 TaxID=3156269 RepID=UPI0035113494